MTGGLDKYYYSRDHDAGPGMWCVRGPDGFKMSTPNLQKGDAYLIGKILSGRIRNAKPEVRAAFDKASEMLAVAENSGIP